MRGLALSVAAALALSLARYALAPALGAWADAILVVPPFWLWLKGRKRFGLAVILLAGFFSDAMLPTPYPLFTAAALLAGSVHITVVEQLLSADNALTRTVAVGLWLIMWRSAYVTLLWLASVQQGDALTPHFPSLGFVAGWIASGMLLWAVLEVSSAILPKFRRTSHAAAR